MTATQTISSARTTTPDWSAVTSAIAAAGPTVRVGVSIRSLDTGATFGHCESDVFSAASTIKMVILVGLARAVDEGRLNLSDMAPVLTTQKVGGSGVLNWLANGLELSLADHAWLMIAISDNTASNVLIDAVGVPAIQAVQRDLGFESMSLNRRFLGHLPTNGLPENVACAADLTTILRSIVEGASASQAQTEWMLKLLADQQHRNRLPRNLPENVTFAGKSGSLKQISHDAGVLGGPGGSAVIAVLTQGFDDPYEADAFIGSIGSALVTDLQLA